MNVGEFIKKRRIALAYSQRHVAMYSGLSNATISRIESGNVNPDADTLIKIAKALKMKPADLFSAIGYIEEKTTKKTERPLGVKIPVLGHVAAGVPIDAIEDILDYEEIPADWTNDGSEYFGLRIKGSSMEPRIQEGDVVILRKQEDIESGEIAAVLVDGANATVKKVLKHDNGLSLVSFNQAYTPVFYTAKEVKHLPVKVIGKVVELRGKF